MDSDWLEDFLALVDCGGFSRAAEQGAVSQPSFSRRIRSLEDWVGATLVDRGTQADAAHHGRGTVQVGGGRDRPSPAPGAGGGPRGGQGLSETLRFASTHVLSLTFFPTWLRRLEADDEPA